ncbi:MAG: hypothetical protein E6P95_04100 [Candidatus Moraniibacteriota bacterium]|nr:MAG: hypothetical protein E6P95_04100 [Candidatus Moranbacteria bacterium]
MITIQYLRSFRFGEFAIFDFTLAYLGVYLLTPTLNKIISPTKRILSRFQWLLLVLPLSIIFHLATGNITPLTKLALDPHTGYGLKALLLIMLYFGLKK